MKNFNLKHKYILLPLITLLIFLVFLAVFQINMYEKEIEIQKNFVYQMLGGYKEEIEVEEIVSNILKGEVNKNQIEIGERNLKNYGYVKGYKTVYDIALKSYKNKIILIYNLIYLSVLCLVFTILYFQHKKENQELENIYNILYDFHKGEYDINLPILVDGVKGKLNNQLESLGNRLKFSENQLNKEKEFTKSLVTDISHQLKTPIASLKICFSLLSEENLEPIERKEFMGRCIEQLNNLENLTASLVNISRMEIGMIKIDKKKKRILDTIISAINVVYLKAEEKNMVIQINNAIEEIENIVLPHDEKWTREGIANILENAIKYSNKGSKITISLQKLTTFLRIEIEDEGIGIDKKEYTDIFKRFYRGKSDIVKKEEGSGIGLYLTRKILEEQGGNIKVISKKSIGGKGSKFIIQFSLI